MYGTAGTCLVRHVAWYAWAWAASERGHKTDSPSHAIPKVSRILDTSTVLMIGINKGHDPILETSQEHLGDQIMEKMASPRKRRCMLPNRGKHIVQQRTLVVMWESQLDTFVPLLQREICVPYMRRNTNSDPRTRSTRYKFHVRQHLHNAKTTDRSQKPWRPVRRSVQQSPAQIIRRGVRLWQPSVCCPVGHHQVYRIRGATSHGGSKKFLFPIGAERKDRGKIKLSSCLDFLKALAECVRRAARLTEWMPTRSGPRPHTEPTPTGLVRIALFGPAVVQCRAWCASALRVALSGVYMDPMYPKTEGA